MLRNRGSRTTHGLTGLPMVKLALAHLVTLPAHDLLFSFFTNSPSESPLKRWFLITPQLDLFRNWAPAFGRVPQPHVICFPAGALIKRGRDVNAGALQWPGARELIINRQSGVCRPLGFPRSHRWATWIKVFGCEINANASPTRRSLSIRKRRNGVPSWWCSQQSELGGRRGERKIKCREKNQGSRNHWKI